MIEGRLWMSLRTHLSSLTRRTWSTCVSTSVSGMELKDIVQKLNQFAPTSLAGSWDNVGLLIEPSPPHQVTRLLVTNDLTEPAMHEAMDVQANMILSYHPPIFTSLKCITQNSWKERIVGLCLENRIAVFSPHTSYDAMTGGVNDWLLQPFVAECGGVSTNIETVHYPGYPSGGGFQVTAHAPTTVAMETKSWDEVILMGSSEISSRDNDVSHWTWMCGQSGLSKLTSLLRESEVWNTLQIIQLQKPPIPNEGPGRVVKLTKPVTIATAVSMVKKHLGLSHVRLALAVGTTTDTEVKSVAVCAGSGHSVLSGVEADLYLTGEMSHHDVLDATHTGHTVILCDHSNTERGFLQSIAEKFSVLFEDKVEVMMSKTDKDPLDIV